MSEKDFNIIKRKVIALIHNKKEDKNENLISDATNSIEYEKSMN
jgi:hypothetical protein